MKATASPSQPARRPPAKAKAPRKAAASASAAVAAVAADGPKRWRRADDDQSMTRELGQRLRAVRDAKGMSLAELSLLCGVPGPTISRIENSKMSPTCGVLARIAAALDVDWIDVLGPGKPASGEPLMSLREPDGGLATLMRGLTCTILHNEDAARLESLLVEVNTQSLEDVGGLVGHRGEEFCYVLSGTLALHFQGREPRILRAGGSALFSSVTPHAYVAAGPEGAKILLVVTRGSGKHAAGNSIEA
jgi:transcriptional regulator with XRE-family HTH domain